MKVDPVRQRAWEILVAVADRGDLDSLLDGARPEFPDTRDRNFLTGLVRGTLQWQGRYDYLIEFFSTRRPPRDRALVCLLRLGLHQLLGMDGVPDFAAIDQTVELCRRNVDRRRVAFVNGLLRNVQRRLQTTSREESGSGSRDGLRALFAPLERDRRAFLAAWHSHPRWLVDSWHDTYGDRPTEQLLAFNNLPVPLDLHVPDPDAVPGIETWFASAGYEAQALDVPGCLRVHGRPDRRVIRELLDSHRQVIVQDASVQEATRWLGEGLAVAPAGAPFVDLCAAPGGKTVNLGERAGRTRLLVAMEPDAARMGLLAATVVRTGTPAVLLRGDGLRAPLAPGSCGAVLLDGPCSGTGVLRRHPEARWRLKPSVIPAKAGVLRELAHCPFSQRPGFGKEVGRQQIVVGDDDGHAARAFLQARVEVEPPAHLVGGGLVLDVHDVEGRRVDPRCDFRVRAVIPILNLAVDGEFTVRRLGREVGERRGQDVEVVSQRVQGGAQLVRERAHSAFQRWVFSGYDSNAHARLL